MPTTVERVLARARGEIGVVEKPRGSNSVKYNQWYYGNDAREPWCAAFVSWCFYHEDLPLPATTSKGFVYTPSGVKWFRDQQRWVDVGSRRPEPGWVVFYDFPNDGVNRVSHVGIVESLTPDGFIAIEGNTDERGGRTGGKVMRQQRRRVGVYGFGMPNYQVSAPSVATVDYPAIGRSEEQMQTKPLEIALDANGRGWSQWDPKLDGDPVIIGLVPQGPYPPVDGYWDDVDEDLTFRAQPRGGSVIVSAVNGQPNSKVLVWVTIA